MHWWSFQLAMAVTLAVSSGMSAVCGAPCLNSDSERRIPDKQALLKRVIANQHHDDAEVEVYEHIEHRQARKTVEELPIILEQAFRVIPTGTGVDKIPVHPDGSPVDPVAYAEELRKLEKALVWAMNTNGRAQREALAKYRKKQKDREELVDATLNAFLFTWMGRESVEGQTLAKLHLDPNPAYKSTSRVTSIFSHVRATVWLDESAGQLARVDAEIFEDMAFGGGVLAKVYKGGHIIFEQSEVAPGIWFPVRYDYNLDGRKFLFAMGMHARTTLKQYKRIGPPAEALAVIRAELNKVRPIPSDP
jgi:hypothetical protein